MMEYRKVLISPTIIYIAGYGRSGSTVLDIMLGDHPRIFSGGELTYLFDDYKRARHFLLSNAKEGEFYVDEVEIKIPPSGVIRDYV